MRVLDGIEVLVGPVGHLGYQIAFTVVNILLRREEIVAMEVHHAARLVLGTSRLAAHDGQLVFRH
jgi:hypothetical protein